MCVCAQVDVQDWIDALLSPAAMQQAVGNYGQLNARQLKVSFQTCPFKSDEITPLQSLRQCYSKPCQANVRESKHSVMFVCLKSLYVCVRDPENVWKRRERGRIEPGKEKRKRDSLSSMFRLGKGI